MKNAPPLPLLLLLTLILAMSPAVARAAIFKYIDPLTRMANYSNFRPVGHAARELIIAPPRPASVARARPVLPARAPMLGVNDFPRIAPARQRQLDADRKGIIGDELGAEELLLRQALDGRAGAEAIGRHQANVAALRRELARLR